MSANDYYSGGGGGGHQQNQYGGQAYGQQGYNQQQVCDIPLAPCHVQASKDVAELG